MRRLILGLFAVLAFVAVASAQTLRIPQSGDPALALAVPKNWTSRYDDMGNLQYSSADRSLNIQLSWITDNDPSDWKLPDVAASILKEGGIPPYTRREPGTIDGRPGETFFSKKTYPSGSVMAFEVTLVRIDRQHIAIVGKVARDGLTAAQLAPLESIVRQVKILGAR